jgi:ATP-dependent Clp protease ATP-binding subunit ClpB
MSEYMEKHAVSVLIGAPPGYDGFEVGGVLTNLMLENGSRILLFDEIEKAHPDVFNIFLQVLSDGRLTDRMGRTVSFENAIILMTTNLGAAAFLDDSLTEEQATAAAMEMIGKEYKPEFLNRFAGRQNIIPFRHLTVPVMERIFTREIGKVNAAYRSRNLSVTIADEDRERLCTKMYKPETGARGLPGYIETQIEPKLVDRVIDHPGEGGELVVKFNEKLELGFAA